MGMVDGRCGDGQDQESLFWGVADHGDEDKDESLEARSVDLFSAVFFFQAQWLCSERKQLRRDEDDRQIRADDSLNLERTS